MSSEKYTLNCLISDNGMKYSVVSIEVEVPIESLICHLTLAKPLLLVFSVNPSMSQDLLSPRDLA